jgi:hypothetical protein
MTDNKMTPDEHRWFNRLYRVIRDMPKTVEIQVHSNHIQMNRVGATLAAFEKHGDGDNAESLDAFNTTKSRVHPCGESI